MRESLKSAHQGGEGGGCESGLSMISVLWEVSVLFFGSTPAVYFLQAFQQEVFF